MTDTAPPDPADVPVVILCGGFGTRIREASERLPKPLIEVGGRPILWHIMKMYSAYGFRRFVLALGYKGDEIRRFFLDYNSVSRDFTIQLAGNTPPVYHGDDGSEDWEVTLVETGLMSGTSHRLRTVAPYLDRSHFLLTYGDGLGSVDIRAGFDQHLASGLMGTVTGVHPTSRYGELHVEGDRVPLFNEKPKIAGGWVSGGFFSFRREMVDGYVSEGADLMLESDALKRLAADGQLGIYKHDGFWQGMDTFKDWTELNELWDDGKAEWKVW